MHTNIQSLGCGTHWIQHTKVKKSVPWIANRKISWGLLCCALTRDPNIEAKHIEHIRLINMNRYLQGKSPRLEVPHVDAKATRTD